MTNKTRTRPKGQAAKQQTKQKASNANMNEITAMVKKAVLAAGKSSLPRSITSPKNNTFLGDVGQWAGNGVSKIFGWGAYKIKQNSMFDKNTGSQVPMMHSSNDSIRLTHREYLGDVSSSVAFTKTTYPVNPGISSTFPYLAALAGNFQEYSFKGLVFEFKSTSANALNSTNTALGSVSMVAQYRSDLPAPASKIALLNEMWAVDTKPCDSIILPVECDPAECPMKVQYIRSSGVPAGSDIKMYDLCNVTIATVGSQATAVVGELWVSYDVELYKPIVSLNASTLAANCAHYVGTNPSGTYFTGTTVSQSFDDIGLTIAANAITFPPRLQGNFIVTMTYTSTAGAALMLTPTLGLTGINPLGLFDGGSYYVSSGASAITTITGIFALTLTGVVSQYVVFTGGNYAATGTVHICVTQVSSSFS